MMWGIDIFSEMERLRRDMNRLFSDYSHSSGASTFPLINIYEDKECVVVTAELPGLNKDQVNIIFSDGNLTLSGKVDSPSNVKNMAVLRKERSEGNFEKVLRISPKVKAEAITASFTNGILTVTLPKAEEAKPKTISIEAK